MARTLGIRREAKAEITEAHDWYKKRRRSLGAEFLAEVKKAFAFIEEAPERFPTIRSNVRRLPLNRFPYSILYLAEPDEIVVLACFHGRRDPKRWQSRT